MTVRELREKYLRFFESKGHTIHDSGSLIPYDVTGRLDESLLFNGAGMIQFKPYFLGTATPPNKRLVTAQKCVRTGDIDEVGDDSHLTFFEMMGNFSFGDYFKKEAIAFSWEFLTGKEWLGLDPKRLSFTVFEDDDEAFDCWSEHISAAGIDPSTRIMRLSEETNYWPPKSISKGSPGPCGPNSEMFYWTNPDTIPGTNAGDYTRDQWIADDEARNWLEIWNDVFIQFDWQGKLRNPDRPSDGWEKSGMPNLPFASIDTGLGLERTVAVLEGKSSVYDTDAFLPILAKIDQLRTSPLLLGEVGERAVGDPGEVDNSPETQTAKRIIADHIRTSCFCIADGVMPANNGRGYVLRRLIRRAVLKGQRVLGFENLFMHEVAESVFENFGGHYKELIARRSIIEETLRSEEALFRRTLGRGSQILQFTTNAVWNLSIAKALMFAKALGRPDTMPFELQDIYQNYIDLHSSEPTGLQRFLNLASADLKLDEDVQAKMEPLIEGLRRKYTTAQLVASLKNAEFNLKEVAKQNHPLDHALYDSLNMLVLPGKAAFQLHDTFGFPIEITIEVAKDAGLTVDLAEYDAELQRARNLSRDAQGIKSAYGDSIHQKRILLSDAPTSTEFTGYDQYIEFTDVIGIDFTDDKTTMLALRVSPSYPQSGGQVGDIGAVTVDGHLYPYVDTQKFEGLIWHSIRGKISEDVIGKSCMIDIDAKRRARIKRNHTATHLLQAALRQVLGTSVTQAGSYVGPDNLRFDFTYGKGMTAGEIAEVERIVNEEALKNTTVTTYVDLPIDEARAKGAMALFGEKYGDKVRMVEIGEFSKELCGGTHVRTTGEIGLFKIVSESSAASGVRRIEAITGEAAYDWVREQNEAVREAANLLKSSPKELVQSVERTVDQLKEEKKKREKAEMAAMSGGTSTNETKDVKGVTLWVKNFGDADQKVASQAIDNEANGKPNQVTLGVLVTDKVTFICKAGAEAVTKGAHAGNLLRELAKIAGGGGGGRADFATAGGKDPSKVEEALDAAESVLASQI